MNNSYSDRELSYKQSELLYGIYKPRWITPFLEEYSETSIGIIIHTGNEVKYLSQKILAMPWIMFTGMIQTVSLARSTSFEF